jgi:serine/threonine-protein kinase
MARLATDDPTPLHALNANVPADLETVVLKCLEKDPARRYDSARALADDLGRWLDGEPIEARRVRLGERLVRRARKNVALTATVAGATLLVLALLAANLAEKQQATRRAALAQRFAQRVERIEARLRESALLPLHDTRPERADVRRELAEMERELAAQDRVVAGPGRYALGRGALALGEPDRARAHLEAAWNGGYREPEVAFALGLSLGAIYQREIDRVQRLPSRELREARRREIEKAFRVPALSFLRIGSAAPGVGPDLAAGLVALYQNKWVDARERAEAAFGTRAGLWEAKRLSGDASIAMARDAYRRGTWDECGAALDAAGSAFTAAAAIARSEPSVFEGDCRRAVLTLDLAIRKGTPGEDTFVPAVKTCDAALAVEPDSAVALSLTSHALWRWHEARRQRGEETRELDERGIALAKKAMETAPEDVEAPINLAVSYWSVGQYEAEHGRDPRPDLERAVSVLDALLARAPGSYVASFYLGSVFQERAQYEMAHGLDPRPSFDRALRSLEHAVAVVPGVGVLHTNLGAACYVRALWERDTGLDPRPSMTRALASFREAARLQPGSYAAATNECGILVERGAWEDAHGLDPLPSLEGAALAGRRAVALNAAFAPARNNLGEALVARARHELKAGRDPRPWLDGAEDLCASAVAANASYVSPRRTLTTALTLRITALAASGRDVSEALARGRAAVAEAVSLKPDDASVDREAGELELAALESGRGGDPAVAASRLARAAELNPRDPQTFRALARLRLVGARAGRAGEAAAGLEAIRRSLALCPGWPESLEVEKRLTALERR